MFDNMQMNLSSDTFSSFIVARDAGVLAWPRRMPATPARHIESNLQTTWNRVDQDELSFV